MDVDDFKSWVHELARDSFARAADKTNVLNRIENSGNDDNFKRLLFTDSEWKNTLEDVATCVQHECEDNVKKLDTRSKAFRSTMQDVWQWMIKMELQAPHADIDAGLYLDALQKLLQHNGDIWKDQHRAPYLDSIKLCKEILDHYSTDDVDLGDFNDLLVQSLANFQTAVASGARSEQYVVAELLEVLTKNLRFVQLDQPITATIAQFARVFSPDNFEWQGKNPARTVLLHIAYLLFVDFSHLYRKELVEGFAPVFRTLFGNVTIGEKSTLFGNDPEPEDDNRDYITVSCKFFEIFVTVAFPFSVIDGFERMEDLRAPCEHFATFLQRALTAQMTKNVLFFSKCPEKLLVKNQCRMLARVFVFQHNSYLERQEQQLEQRTPKRTKTASTLQEITHKDIGVEYLPIICEIFTHFRSSLDSRIKKRLVKSVLLKDFTKIRECGCIPAYINTLATILSQDYSFIDDSHIKCLYQRAINWLHIPLANESASKLIMAVLQWMPKRFGAEAAVFFDSALKSVCRLTQFTKQTIRLLVFLLRTHDFNETHVFRDDLAVEGAWKFRKQLIALMLREVKVDVDGFSNLLLSLLFIEPRAVEGNELEERKHDDVLNVEEDLRWTLSDPLVHAEKKALPPECLSVTLIDELLLYLLQQIEQTFYSEETEPIRCTAVWRTFTIFCIKLLKFKEAQCPSIDVTRVLELKKRMDETLDELVAESDEKDFAALDVHAYWEAATVETKRAINQARARFSSLTTLTLFWSPETAPVSQLEDAIKQPRVPNGEAIGKIVTILFGKQKLVGKIRMLKRFGRFLDAREYSALASALITEVETVTRQPEVSDEYAKFLRQVLCSEIILCADGKVSDFKQQFDYLTKHAPPGLILTLMPLDADDHHALTLWFGENCRSVEELPHHFGFFARRLMSALPDFKQLPSFLPLLDPVQHDIRFFLPKYPEIRQFVDSLSQFQEGRMADGSVGWAAILQRRTFSLALLSFRVRVHPIVPLCRELNATAIFALALAALTRVVGELQLDGVEDEDVHLLLRDAVSIGHCLITELLNCRVDDNHFLSDVVADWLNAVASTIRPGDEHFGFSVLDLLYGRKEEFPHLWARCLQSTSSFALQYKMILEDVNGAATPPPTFEAAYAELLTGRLDYASIHFPLFRTRLFWLWMRPRLVSNVLPDKSIPLLQFFYLFFPHLRPDLCHVLCLFSEAELRAKYHKLFARYLNHEDEANVKFLATTFLFDFKHEFLLPFTLYALYDTLGLFFAAAECCRSDGTEVAPPADPTATTRFDSFVRKCFDENQFGVFKFFRLAAVTERPFAVFLFLSLWNHLETKKNDAVFVTTTFEEFLLTLDGLLEDHELLLLAGVCKVLCYVPKFLFQNRIVWIKQLVKAELWVEAEYYIKYTIDFHENSKRSVFHLKAAERISYIRSADPTIVEDVAEAFAAVVIAQQNEVTAVSLPLQNQVSNDIRALMAESRRDWGACASLNFQSGKLLKAAEAQYHLGQTKFDLDSKDNYRFLIDVSTWPAEEPADISYPKSIGNHNASLFSSFVLSLRKAEIKTDVLWKKRFDELHAETYNNFRLLNECRDLKLIERLRILRTTRDEVLLPSDADLGLASAFLLAGWTTSTTEDSVDPVHELHFCRMQEFLLARLHQLRELKSLQRAQSLVNVMDEVILQLDASHRSTIGLERARLHVCNNEKNAAIYLLEKLLRQHRASEFCSQSQTLQKSRGDTQAQLFVAELCGSKSEHYYQEAVKTAAVVRRADPKYLYECALRYAQFAFGRYSELDAHTKSPYFQLQVEAIQQHDQRRRRSRRDEAELHAEQAENDRILSERTRLLCAAAANFMQALAIDQSDKTLIFHVAALIIENVDCSPLMREIDGKLLEVPARVWIPVAEILSSYLFSEKPVAETVKKQRRAVAMSIFKTCSSGNPGLAKIIKTIKAELDILTEFGTASVEGPQFRGSAANIFVMRPNTFRLQKEFATMAAVPIPTLEQPVNEAGDYSTDGMVLFAKHFDEVMQANGLSAPKVLRVMGNDGTTYRIIFKNECLRQDSILTLLFSIANFLLEKTTFRNEKLRPLHTYRVVPIDRKLGLIEWCQNTMSLNDYLVGPDKNEGAHRRLRPKDMKVTDAMKRLNRQNQCSSQQLRQMFMEVCEKLSPVFRYYFYENFPQPHQFVKRVKHYTDSLALWSMVGFIAGLGDRHLNNILIDKKTAELVHIDLGMVFEYSKRVLPIAERVGFRLTRDMVDPILVEGLNGRFKHVSMHALTEIRKYTEVLVGIASIILHDPIVNFQMPAAANSNDRNIMAETAISRLRRKLEGRDFGVAQQSVEQQVTQLVNDARDPNNLALMFVGWLPFC